VVGAGFSTEFGYPMAGNLLQQIWPRLPSHEKETLEAIICFHHPRWDRRPATLPDIEELLTELDVNADFLPTIRLQGPFNPDSLRDARENLLLAIARWFHEIHEQRRARKLLRAAVDHIRSKNAAIISFNWDYELDRALFKPPTASSYGLSRSKPTPSIVLLKPHGSLNWYPATSGGHIKQDLREKLWTTEGHEVYCFLPWREPLSTRRKYLPLLVPPTHLKDFREPMLRHIWLRCVDILSTARTVYFLGYSLPAADWHSRYILRCGFHNQREGLPHGKARHSPTGGASVIIVNPDSAAFRRIESVVGRECCWIPSRISEWDFSSCA